MNNFFAPQPRLGVQVLLLTEKGRVLYDIPIVQDLRIDTEHAAMRGWSTGPGPLGNPIVDINFHMRPLPDENGEVWRIYDEERMRSNGDQYFRNERAEVKEAVKALERGTDGVNLEH